MCPRNLCRRLRGLTMHPAYPTYGGQCPCMIYFRRSSTWYFPNQYDPLDLCIRAGPKEFLHCVKGFLTPGQSMGLSFISHSVSLAVCRATPAASGVAAPTGRNQSHSLPLVVTRASSNALWIATLTPGPGTGGVVMSLCKATLSEYRCPNIRPVGARLQG